MKLVDAYQHPSAKQILFELLLERRPEQNISHKSAPSWDQHCVYFDSRPHLAWYLIEEGGQVRGACYMTHQREIGIFIFERYHGHHYGRDAVAELMHLHPGRFVANINSANAVSIALFRKLGFGGAIQLTLESTS